MISKIKLAWGDAIVAGEQRFECRGRREDTVVLGYITERTGEDSETHMVPGKKLRFYAFPKSQTGPLVQIQLLAANGIGLRWLFEVEAPDDIKITIDRWWTPKKGST